MNEKLIIPISIIIAGCIIGAAIFFSGGKETVVQAPVENQPQQEANPEIRKVAEATDHILGNPQADFFVVEYSDIDCPFCKRYNDEVMSRLEAEYRDNDRVAFVYRHFPLDAPFTRELHPSATEQAVAMECVADLVSNDAFFAFKKALFADEQTGQLFGDELLAKMSEYATAVGAEKLAFENCYAAQDLTQVTADFNDGRNGGVEGTPTIFVQLEDGTSYRAQPSYAPLKNAIEVFLQNN